MSISGWVRLLEELHSATVGQCSWVKSRQSYVFGLHGSLAMKLVPKGKVDPLMHLI